MAIYSVLRQPELLLVKIIELSISYSIAGLYSSAKNGA